MTLSNGPESAAPRTRGLLRVLGVGFGLAVIVGSVLGVGILRTPGLVAAQLPSQSSILMVWIVGGLYTLLASVCLTELGTMLPQAGGYYVYARRAFGDAVGFAVGWTDWLTYCAVLGYVSIAMGEFTAVLIPALLPAVRTVAISILVFFTLLQVAGVRISSTFQQVTTAIKFLAFLALVIACFAYAASSPAASAPAGLQPLPAAGFAGLIIALQSVVITYGGWQSALYFTEEDRDPKRNLPRSTIGGVLSILVVYLLVNIALLAVLPIPVLARSTLPAADAAQMIFGGRGAQIITVLSIVSLPPLLNAILMIATRVMFALGRDGLLWSQTAFVNVRGTPAVAAVITTTVSTALILSGTFQKLVAVASFYLALNCLICCLGLIVLRKREPRLDRPFLAWGYPWSAVIVLVAGGAFLIGALVGDTQTALVAVALLVVGVIGHLVASRIAAGPSRASAN